MQEQDQEHDQDQVRDQGPQSGPQPVSPLAVTDPEAVAEDEEEDALPFLTEAVPANRFAPATEAAGGAFDHPKLHKVLADAGVGSRREMEELILAGRVSVNGTPAHIGQRISHSDQVKVNGKPIRIQLDPPPVRVLAYHKPAGEIVTKSDPQQRITVFQQLPSVKVGRWITVGRLDVSTEGLLIFTTSGELANRLMHPRSEIEREYAVRVFGELTPEALQKMRDGVELDDGPAHFDNILEAGGEGANRWWRVTLKEGRNREVRRIFDAVGVTVSRLIRIRYGIVALPPGLKRGQSADLSAESVTELMASVGLKQRQGGRPGTRSRPGGRAGARTKPESRPQGGNRAPKAFEGPCRANLGLLWTHTTARLMQKTTSGRATTTNGSQAVRMPTSLILLENPRRTRGPRSPIRSRPPGEPPSQPAAGSLPRSVRARGGPLAAVQDRAGPQEGSAEALAARSRAVQPKQVRRPRLCYH